MKIEQTYYKITNKAECHKGYQYVDGLNILDKAFEPVGTCVAGGLYFTTAKHIFNYLHCGCNLREITLPKDCQWVQDPQRDKFRADRIILGKKYDLADPLTFQLLLEEGADIHALNDRALCWASRKGHLDVVKYLVEKGADIHANNDYALGPPVSKETIGGLRENLLKQISRGHASRKGHLDIVQYLLEIDTNNQANADMALNIASEHGHSEIVKHMVEVGADIHSKDDHALRWASRKNHPKVVKYLVEKEPIFMRIIILH